MYPGDPVGLTALMSYVGSIGSESWLLGRGLTMTGAHSVPSTMPGNFH